MQLVTCKTRSRGENPAPFVEEHENAPRIKVINGLQCSKIKESHNYGRSH